MQIDKGDIYSPILVILALLIIISYACIYSIFRLLQRHGFARDIVHEAPPREESLLDDIVDPEAGSVRPVLVG